MERKIHFFRNLIERLIKRYCPFNAVSFQIAAGVLTTLLLGTVLVMSLLASREVTKVVTDDFNRQQLMLARHASRQIENYIGTFKRELLLLSLSPSLQYFEKVAVGRRMGYTFSSIKENGATGIRYVENETRRTHNVGEGGYRVVAPESGDTGYLKWASHAENKGSIRISDAFHEDGRLIMRMATPVWQVSVDETNPRATGRYSGVLIFAVDVTRLVAKVTFGIHSGETGYAWVIDGNGAFLYHPEKEFIGKNAFEARKEKKPTVSFARINEIQKTMMLTGGEGTSWYVSGWHLGQHGEIKKLIAYSPIHLSETEGQIWSVAVVAPVSEIEDAVSSIHTRQLILQAMIILLILMGGVAVVYLMISWSNTLEREVAKKTGEFKKSEQRYRSLVENAEDIIFTVDSAGDYLSINAYGARFFGKGPDEIIGRNMSEVILRPGAEVPLTTVSEVFETKKGKQITHPVTVGEHEHWLNTNFRRLFDEEGRMYAVLGISRDITDRKKMEETSYHTEKLASMGTLAAGVAHEINNPLAIILGFSDLLLEKSAPGSRQYDMLKRIEAQGLKAKGVVENLLSFARYTEQKEELVDINKDITALLPVVENTLNLNRISLGLDLEEGLPQVNGCAEELQQVFFNIIINAVAAMRGGGSLTIATRRLDGRIEIRLADTGHGIKKEHRGKIFDPLFTTKKIGEGTGLGLSVSYGIVLKHGGTISFETKTEEESRSPGTAFIITLPAVSKKIKPEE